MESVKEIHIKSEGFMSFDGFMMYHLIREYQSMIIPSKLEGIFFELPDRFAFHLYNGKKIQLIIDLNAQGNKIYYEHHRSKPTASHPFLNTLRKYLNKASITRFSQHSTDRVLMIDIQTYDVFEGKKDYTLIVESMGKHANLILTSDSIIVDAYKKVVSLDGRSVYPNIAFQFFHSNKVSFFEMTQPSDDALFIQKTYEGLSPSTATYLAKHALLPHEVNVKPTLKHHQMTIFEVEGCTSFKTINELMKQDITASITFTHELQLIKKVIHKKNLKQGNLLSDYSFHENNLTLKDAAEKLLSYPHQHEKHAQLEGITLNESKTVIENINLMFEQYKKANRALSIIKEHMEMNLGEINVLEQLVYDLEQQTISHADARQCMIDLKLINPNKHIQKPQKVMYKHLKKETYDIFYGVNSVQNNYVTHQLAKHNDYFMHVKDAPGSHVIYRGDTNDPGFKLALQIAAYHSKLRHSSSIPVNVTLKKHVKKIPGLYGSYVRLKTYQTKYIDIDDDFVNMWDNV